MPGQGRHQLRPAEAPRTRLVFTMLEQRLADPPPGVIGANEEGPDAGGVAGRVESGGRASGMAVRAEKGRAEAPAAAGHDIAVDLEYVVRTVLDELRVDAKRRAQ